MKVNCFVVWTPFPNEVKVTQSKCKQEFYSPGLERHKEDVKHQNKFNQEVVNKVKENVPWFVIGPIGVVLIVLKLFINGLRNTCLFSFCQF